MNPSDFSTVPKDILLKMLIDLPEKDINSFCSSNKEIRTFCKKYHDFIWISKLRKDFNIEYIRSSDSSISPDPQKEYYKHIPRYYRMSYNDKGTLKNISLQDINREWKEGIYLQIKGVHRSPFYVVASGDMSDLMDGKVAYTFPSAVNILQTQVIENVKKLLTSGEDIDIIINDNIERKHERTSYSYPYRNIEYSISDSIREYFSKNNGNIIYIPQLEIIWNIFYIENIV